MATKIDYLGNVTTTLRGNNRIDYERYKQDRKNRSYSWTSSVRKRVQRRVAYMAHTYKNCYFVTLTFPEEPNDHSVVKKYVDNLVKRGYIRKYLWVFERGSKGGRWHYHLFFSGCDSRSYYRGENRRLDIEVFQQAWSSALESSGLKSSKNSFRLGKKPHLENATATAKYISKYMTKGQESDVKLYASSSGLKEFETVPVVQPRQVTQLGSVLSTFKNENVIIESYRVNSLLLAFIKQCREEYEFLKQFYENF